MLPTTFQVYSLPFLSLPYFTAKSNTEVNEWDEDPWKSREEVDDEDTDEMVENERNWEASWSANARWTDL